MSSLDLSSLRVALAHHWLVGMRGGERVLEHMCRMFPGAPIHTLVTRAEKISRRLQSHPIYTSWLQRIPGGPIHYKKLLPLFPSAVSSLRIDSDYDLILSSDASLIKGVSCPPEAIHVCYCHSPPRYLWDMLEEYRNSSEIGGSAGRAFFNSIVPRVREFDLRASQKVTHFIANSHFVRRRIEKFYGRKATVINPPVDVEDFPFSDGPPEDYHLVVSQLVPYKKVELAVAAFTKLKKNLVVIGEGSERQRLQQMAGPTVRFLGHQPAKVVREHYQRCRSLVFPGIEDFGITPLEAQACGRPVIAFRKGGALETVLDNITGVFFDDPTVDSLAAAVEKLEKTPIDPYKCRRNAMRFNPDRFRRQLASFLSKVASKGMPMLEPVLT